MLTLQQWAKRAKILERVPRTPSPGFIQREPGMAFPQATRGYSTATRCRGIMGLERTAAPAIAYAQSAAIGG